MKQNLHKAFVIRSLRRVY